MKKIIILTLVILLISSYSIYAINGHVSLDYDTMSGEGRGELYLYERIGKFDIGGKVITDLMAFRLKDGYFPAGVPESQIYDLIIKYRMTDRITFELTEGCKHFLSQSGKSAFFDEEYIKVGAKYEF